MRLSELHNRELIDLSLGERIGLMSEAELTFDQQGRLLAVTVPQRRHLLEFLRGQNKVNVDWQDVKKVGPKVILIESEPGESAAEPASSS